MTVIQEPGDDILEPEYQEMPDFDLTVRDVAIPCECPHSSLGSHFSQEDKPCENIAVWRVTFDCDCPTKHTHLYCNECKLYGDSVRAFFSSERIG